MNFKDSTNLQKISSCGISLFGGLGIYLAAANHLGIARLPALLIALAATFILLFVYRLLLKSASNSPEGTSCGGENGFFYPGGGKIPSVRAYLREQQQVRKGYF